MTGGAVRIPGRFSLATVIVEEADACGCCVEFDGMLLSQEWSLGDIMLVLGMRSIAPPQTPTFLDIH